jgi:MYXO-CTERM domain-containing protein
MLSLARVGSLCIITLLAVGCAAEPENVEDASQDVTGGTASVEPPTVYFFETGSKVKCVGVLLGESVAITAKSCAKKGLVVKRFGSIIEANVTEVSIPNDKNADIAVVRLDRKMPGPFAVITQAPLRDGYTVNSIDTNAERNIISSIDAQMVSETDTHGAMLGKNGAQICTTDIGAPVCSSVLGTCGLAGIIVGAPDAPVAPKVENGNGTTAPADPGAEVQRTCPTGAWKVAQLGRHAAFLQSVAPEAFEPFEFERTAFGGLVVLGTEKVAPEGLWGFKSAGTVKTCKIETPKLDAAKVAAESKVSAKVSFTNMEQRATAWGRFGIAPKSAPTAIRWLPAKSLATRSGATLDTTFEGTVSADKDGDFIVSFRASANGGESWTQCDLDGIENGFSIEKSLALKVGAGDKPGETKPQDAPASPTSPSKSADDRPGPDDDAKIGEGNDDGSGDATGDDPVTPKKKKKAAAGGCSAAPTSTPDTSFAIFGLAAVVGSLVRRRKRA